MKIGKDKTMAITLAIILISSTALSLYAIPEANAHNPPWGLTSHIYVAWCPETVGLGQSGLIVWWSNWIPQTAVGEMGDRWYFTVNVTSPDGKTQTRGPYMSDPVGGGYISYTFDQAGTYSVIAIFPQTTLTGIPGNTQNAYVNDTFTAGVSDPAYITIGQEQVPAYKETPLPTDYWTRPIYGANRYWSEVAANYLGPYAAQNGTTTSYAYGTGPLSAHVLWTSSYWSGGVMDEKFPAIGYYTGTSYEGFGNPTIIEEGKIYYAVSGGSQPNQGWYCLDLYTGEQIYFENNTLGNMAMPSVGEVLDIEFPNQHGGFPYLWRTSGVNLGTGNGTCWQLLDAFSDDQRPVCTIANVSASGTQFRDAIGSLCYINFVNKGTADAPNYYMQIWNSTDAIQYTLAREGLYPPRTMLDGTTGPIAPTTTSNDYWMWRPSSSAPFNGNNGFSMNVSVASIYGPRNAILNQTMTVLAVRPDQYVIVGTNGRNDARGNVPAEIRAISLKGPNWGTTLWDNKFSIPAATDAYSNNTYIGYSITYPVAINQVDPEDNVIVFYETVTRKYFAFDLQSGQQLWETSEGSLSQFNFYSSASSVWNGELISYGGGMANSGVLNAYNIRTGELLWNWTAPIEGIGETWYPYTPLSLGAICNGHGYFYSTEHSATMPLRRDSMIWCVDLTSGKLVWKMSNWANGGLKIVDGRLIDLNLFDNAIYCYGIGPSATTVSAPQTNPTLGSSVTITGTVTDQSPSGRHNVAGSIDFTLKGTPAISDADMEAWMEYMFQQRPLPTNATGVPVVLTAIDPNGNFITIGNVTSDVTGTYGCNWTPEIPGTYQIIATFKGSNSYGSSFAQTYMGVSEAASTASPYPITAQQPTEMYIVGIGIAIIVAIAIVGTLLALMIRKRP